MDSVMDWKLIELPGSQDCDHLHKLQLETSTPEVDTRVSTVTSV